MEHESQILTDAQARFWVAGVPQALSRYLLGPCYPHIESMPLPSRWRPIKRWKAIRARRRTTSVIYYRDSIEKR